MTRRSLAGDGSPENVARLGRGIVDRFEVELSNHFAIEEQVLFPACGPLPIVGELVAEHRVLEGLVEEIRRAPVPELLERFCELLSTHIRREERELFEAVQRDLPHDLLESLGHEIDRRVVRVCL
jgi:hemerythrin-like domain-containing protein